GLPEMRDTVPAGDADMIRKVKAHMLSKTRDEWLAIIPKEISVVPMLEFDHPLEGRVRQLASPIRLSDTPPTFRRFAPVLGEHTVEVLQSIGYSENEIGALEKAG